ncbi:MAG: sulfite exporter TauE/SafE family protein [Verrucomicrobia bacterium]|nr:sulfite exporter TauE/SafE family protein [Verrucomicrobiota bacterium]
MILSFFAYAIVGALSGVLAGLLGISGGLITIPFLVLIFNLLGFAPVYLMQLAIGTSLAAMTFNALAATWSHNQRGNVNWDLVRRILWGLILGCIIGAFLGHIIPTVILQILFGVFAIIVGFHFFKQKPLYEKEHALPAQGTLNAISLIIAAVSNILGIGGGTMTMPVFLAFRMPMKKAVGTSAATGFIITTGGAISYLFFGLENNFYPHSIGYIYLPAFAILAVTTFFAAPFGARLTAVIPPEKLKKYFSIALMVAGILMFF